MVFGHNLHHMAPFEFLRAGFCMVFQRASFVVHAQGWIVEPLVRFGDPQADILARGPFGGSFGVPENILLV